MRRKHGSFISLLLAAALLAGPAHAQAAPEELRYRYSGVDYVFFGPSPISELQAGEGVVRLVLPPRAEQAVWPAADQVAEGRVRLRFQAPLNAREVWLFMARQLLRQEYALLGAAAVEDDRIASLFAQGDRRVGLAVEREDLDVLEGYEFVVVFDLTPTEGAFADLSTGEVVRSELGLVDVVFDNLLRPQRVPAGAASEIFTPVNPLATAPRGALIEPALTFEQDGLSIEVFPTSDVRPLDVSDEVRLGPPRGARDLRVARNEGGAVLMQFESRRGPLALLSDLNRLLDRQGFELTSARRSGGARTEATFTRDATAVRVVLERRAAREGFVPYTLLWEVNPAGQ